MTDTRSVTSSVEVAADPDTAFSVFTKELGCWWKQGPINFYDATRAYGKRMEEGVGGRIIEVYDESTGEGLEIARITDWEPGSRLAWTSSVDDVLTEVSFTKTESGTVVRVDATIPAGGVDRGGTSWVRVTPAWLGSWLAERDSLPHEPLPMSRLAVAVHYEQPCRAARWLRDVFALEPAGAIPDDDAYHEHGTWIEFQAGTAAIIVFRRDGATPAAGAGVTHTPWVFVDDLDEHYARAKAGGATVVEEIWHHGARAYTAADLEGNHWTFAQASPLMRRPPSHG